MHGKSGALPVRFPPTHTLNFYLQSSSEKGFFLVAAQVLVIII